MNGNVKKFKTGCDRFAKNRKNIPMSTLLLVKHPLKLYRNLTKKADVPQAISTDEVQFARQ